MSVIEALVALATPKFCTATVYTNVLETNTGVGLAESVSCKSASPAIPTKVVVVDVLLAATGSVVLLEVTLVMFWIAVSAPVAESSPCEGLAQGRPRPRRRQAAGDRHALRVTPAARPASPLTWRRP